MFHNFVLEAIEQGLQVDIIFTDFTKVFDHVDHSVLMETLSRTGFGEPILSRFKSYQSGRIDWEKICDKKSTVSRVSSTRRTFIAFTFLFIC